MTEMDFLIDSYHLLRRLPVCDVHLQFSEDFCNDQIVASLDGPLTVKHFKELADTVLNIELNRTSLIIHHPDYISF